MPIIFHFVADHDRRWHWFHLHIYKARSSSSFSMLPRLISVDGILRSMTPTGASSPRKSVETIPTS